MNNDKENIVFIKPSSKNAQNSKKKIHRFFSFIDLRDTSLIPLQLLLAVISIVEGFNAVGDLFSHAQTIRPHVYAHLGAYTLAYAVSLLAIACRPARARGMLLFVSVGALAFFVTSIVDIVQGRAALAGEIGHITKFIAPFIVWIIATRIRYFSKTTLRDQ